MLDVLPKLTLFAPLDKVCVLSCGISTGLGATLNIAKPKKGSSFAIFGLGAVGLAAAKGARIAGASRIIGVDLNANRFELAKKFGVTEFVNPKDYKKPVQEVIAEMTNGGVDRSVECTGHIDAMISAFECVHDGWGVAVLVGVPHKDAVFKSNPMNLLNERTLKGTFFGNYKPRSDIPSVVEKYMNKDDLMKLRNEHSVESMSDKSILEKVLGRSFVRLHGWGRDPTTARSNTNRNSDRASYNVVMDELDSLEKTCTILQVLIDNNLMPLSATTKASQQNQRDTSE